MPREERTRPQRRKGEGSVSKHSNGRFQVSIRRIGRPGRRYMYVDREEDAPAAIDPLELMEIARLDLMEWTETFLQQWLDSRADPDRREQVVQEFLVTWIQVSGTLGERLGPGAIRDEVSCRRPGSDARKSEADPPT
jgi:hypothetical protein